MAGGAQKDDDEIISDINVTPLVDVVLVLLIILMVTATAIANNAIDMELPESRTAESNPQTPETLNINVNARGDIFVDAQRVTLPELQRRAAAAKRRSADSRAIIASDRAVSYGRIIEIMDALRQGNLGKISFKADRAATPRQGN